MRTVDQQGRHWDFRGKTKDQPAKARSTYSYKLRQHHPDILLRLAKGESMASIAARYACSYQAIQYVRSKYGQVD